MATDSHANIVARWWSAIDAADFDAAAALLADDAFVDWPLSNERMASPVHWRQVNVAYPGKWRARILSQVAEGNQVMTIVQVFDQSIQVIVISHFTLAENRIINLVEYWPEAYAAPSWRAQWTVPLDSTSRH